MSIFVQLDPVPWEILDRVRARILANRRENNREQRQVTQPQRTATRARFNKRNQNYRRPEASAPLPDVNMFLAWERTTERDKTTIVSTGAPGSGNYERSGIVETRLVVASANGKAMQTISSGALEFLEKWSSASSMISIDEKYVRAVSRWFPAPSGIIYTAALVQVEYTSTLEGSNLVGAPPPVYNITSEATTIVEMSAYITDSRCALTSVSVNNTANTVKSALASGSIVQTSVQFGFDRTTVWPEETAGTYPVPIYEPGQWGAIYREIPEGAGFPAGTFLGAPVSPAGYVSNEVDATVYDRKTVRDAAFAAAYETQLQSRDPELPPRRMRYKRPAYPEAFKDLPSNEVVSSESLLSASDFGLTSYVRTKAAAFGI